jgi:histidine ammonia-lyase
VPGALILRSAADLDAAVIRQVADGLTVRLAPGLAEQVQAGCDRARAVLRDGAPVYGVTTGMGAFAGVRLSPAEQLAHQRNLLVGRATGGAPWLPASDVRMILAVRLRTFLSCDAAVSAALCQRLLDFLTAGIVPAVPADGAGSAGEIVQLAHCFGPLAGIGSVLAPGSDGKSDNKQASEEQAGEMQSGGRQSGGGQSIRSAGAALREHGLPAYELGPKEGIALLAGVPGATALSLLADAEARSAAALLTASAALSIAAVQAPVDPYGEACARADETLALVLRRLRELICPARPPRMLQAPVSFRVAGHVLAQLERASDGLAAAADRALAGVTDSPAFLNGAFTGTAGFHGIDLAAACDHAAAAVVHACEVSAARTHRLLDPAVTGLPAQLAARPGPDAGLVAVHKRAAGEVHALRRLAMPSPVGLIETSGGQEDVQSFAWEAAVNLRAALRRARVVAACEALTAFQAASMTVPDAVWPPGCARLLNSLRKFIQPIDADRPLGADIGTLAGGEWLSQN